MSSLEMEMMQKKTDLQLCVLNILWKFLLLLYRAADHSRKWGDVTCDKGLVELPKV